MATQTQLTMVLGEMLERMSENQNTLTFGVAVDEAAEDLGVELDREQRERVMVLAYNTMMAGGVPGAAEA